MRAKGRDYAFVPVNCCGLKPRIRAGARRAGRHRKLRPRRVAGRTEANPPLQTYFGTDKTRYAEQSALPGMAKSKVPMLLAMAELDPPDFYTQTEQARASLCQAGVCPQTIKLLGHNHMSEVFSINTDDQVLTGALGAFISAR